MRTHYVSVKLWAVYVKEAHFFRSQGGLTEDWGKSWIPVESDSIEGARQKGEEIRSRKHPVSVKRSC